MIKFVKAIRQFVEDLNTFCDVYIEEVTGIEDY